MRTEKNNQSSRSQASKGSASTARNAASEKIVRSKRNVKALDDQYNFVCMASDLIGQFQMFSERDLAKIMKDLTVLTASSGSGMKEVSADCVSSLGQIAEIIVYIASNRQELDQINDYFMALQSKIEGRMPLDDN